MNDWILLTPALFCESLTTEQNETLGSRPNQGTVLDPLDIALAEAIAQVRAAVRTNGLNRLSSQPQKIPAELAASACSLAQGKLEAIWPLFFMSEKQKEKLTAAEHTLVQVSEGKMPVLLPSDPEPSDTVRRTVQVSLLRQRSKPVNSKALRGL